MTRELSFYSAKSVKTLLIQLSGQEGFKLQKHFIHLYSTGTYIFPDIALTRYFFRTLHLELCKSLKMGTWKLLTESTDFR